MSTIKEAANQRHQTDVYFFSMFWWAVYIGTAIAISLTLLVAVLFPLGLSVGSNFVFGFLALISGVLTDLVFRKAIKRRMMISETIRFSILYVWIPVTLYFAVLGPFE